MNSLHQDTLIEMQNINLFKYVSVNWVIFCLPSEATFFRMRRSITQIYQSHRVDSAVSNTKVAGRIKKPQASVWVSLDTAPSEWAMWVALLWLTDWMRRVQWPCEIVFTWHAEHQTSPASPRFASARGAPRPPPPYR